MSGVGGWENVRDCVCGVIVICGGGVGGGGEARGGGGRGAVNAS